VKYKFKCRNVDSTINKFDHSKLNYFKELINDHINHLANLKLTHVELFWLSKIRFFKPDFIDFLSSFKLNTSYVKCEIIDNELSIIIEGPWIQTIWFEVPILAIVSELYCMGFVGYPDEDINTIDSKINFMKNKEFKFADMGTRRRFSYQEQLFSINHFKKLSNFVGTSNLHFAKTLNLTPIGTMAHEWIQAHQQLTSLNDSQKTALDVWAHEYRGDLGIALSDTLGFDVFLQDFDLYFAKLFDGCRHDSGDPYEWTTKLINHYKNLNIDPKTKTVVYSDGLNFEKCNDLFETFKSQINISFGIGTWLTNDVGIEPLQIVIKMVECNGKPVAKISDDPEKGMCENKYYLKYLKSLF